MNNLKERAYREVTDAAIELTKDMSYEQLRQFAVDLSAKLAFKEHYNQLLKNAQFAANNDYIQLPLMDLETNEPVISREDINKQVEQLQEDWLQKAQDALEIMENETECLARKIKSIEKLASVTSRQKKRSTKMRKQPDPDEVVQFNLSGQTCPVCGSELVSSGYKSKTIIEYMPARIKVIERQTEVGTCPKKCLTEDGKSVVVAARPDEPDLLDKSLATESLVTGIAYDKYLMGTPTYRLEKNFSSFGIALSRQTMSNITIRASKLYLEPVISHMIEHFRQLHVIHADETTLKCLQIREEHKTSTVIVGCTGRFEEDQMALYLFSPDKKQEFVHKILGDSFKNAMMTDGLQAYTNYPAPAIKLNCMAHARRKFVEALRTRDDYKALVESTNKENGKPGQEALDILDNSPALNVLIEAVELFNNLYHVETLVYDETPERIGEAREKVSRPIFNQLVEKAADIQDGFEEETPGYRAGDYFMDRVDSLGRFLDDGRYPIDNNRCEQAVKNFVMARKNFLFCKTVEGAESAAAYMTMFISAKMNGLNPYKYVEYVFHTLKFHKDGKIPKEVLDQVVPYSKNLPAELYSKK